MPVSLLFGCFFSWKKILELKFSELNFGESYIEVYSSPSYFAQWEPLFRMCINEYRTSLIPKTDCCHLLEVMEVMGFR